MSRILEILKTFLVNDSVFVFSIAAGIDMLGVKLDRRRYFLLRAAAGLLAIGAAATYLSYVSRPEPGVYILSLCVLKYVVLFFLFIGYAAWNYKASLQVAAFIATVSYCIQNMAERLMEIPLEWHDIPSGWSRVILAAFTGLLLYAFSRLIMGNKGFSENGYSKMDKRLLLMITSVVLIFNIILDMLMRGQFGQSNGLTRSYMHLMSSAISFMAIILSMCQFRQADSDINADIASQLLYNEQKRYEEDKLLHDTINIKCHDIRHQLAALGQQGYNKELNEIGRLVNIYDTRYRTGCPALDVILSNKALTCANSGIMLTCVADGKRMGFLETSDVYALFGNILDNAVDAVRRVTDEDKKIITASVSVRQGMLWITEENFYEGSLDFRDDLPVTTKEDTLYHGFGMKSIAILVDKYDGSMKITTEDQVYRISIMIPIPTDTGE